MTRLRDLELKPIYDLEDNLIADFYIPALRQATRYDRAVAYFSSQALAGAAAGMSHFIRGGGTIRLVVSPQGWHRDDIQALRGQTSVPEDLARRLAESLVPESDIQRERLSVLAWLVQEGRLETRIILPPPGKTFYHGKIGILYDRHEDGVAFWGSANETLSGWDLNVEDLYTGCSWKSPDQQHAFRHNVQRFESFWQSHKGFQAVPLPDAVRDQLLALAPDSPPLLVDPLPPPPPQPEVHLYAHQESGRDELVAAFPESRLLADEVGLGKTITAAGALMRLRETGQCPRALILAPANVCVQWQEELQEKFGVACPRLGSGQVHMADGTSRPRGSANPFAEHDLLIASSHLVRRREWRQRLEAAPSFDLVILDEAHHARRSAPGSNVQQGRRRPNLMLQLLEETLVPHARCLWLLTATPIQIHLVEFFDLLHAIKSLQEPDRSPLQSWPAFEQFYQALASSEADQPAWNILGSGVGSVPYRIPDSMAISLKPSHCVWIEHFGQQGRDPHTAATNLIQQGHRDLLMKSLYARSPGGRMMLRRTRRQMDMQRLFAQRVPIKREIDFGSAEARALYHELDEFLLHILDRQENKHKGMGFILSIYRKRLTSSWFAVEQTIQRTLQRQGLPTREMDLLEWGWDPGAADEELPVLAHTGFSSAEMDALHAFTDRIHQMVTDQPDPKIAQLQRDIRQGRRDGVSMLLFTQFWDTLSHLREFLTGAYQEQVACYSGHGAERWQEGKWYSTTKEDLAQAFAQREIAILLCTDAASEGLNLQTASTLINYDLPWNPMRVEQRIGRIDRINQQSSTLKILNYVMQDTIEDRVYEVLENRIRVFEGAVGHLQPILGRVEDALIQRSPDEVVKAFDDLEHWDENAGAVVEVALSVT